MLTRSGRELEGRPERAILRVDAEARFLDGYRLPVPAVSMVYLPRRHRVVLADDEDGLHLCDLPARMADHDPGL